MNHRPIRILLTALIAIALASCCPVQFIRGSQGETKAGASALKIKPGEPQLFVDDFLIADQENLRRTLNMPKKDDGGLIPLLSFKEIGIEDPGTLEANGSIVFDPKLNKYVMFCLAYRTSMTTWQKTQLYRFTSDDGINWTVGDDGTTQPVFPMSIEDLFDEPSGLSATNIDLFSCYYDTSDQKMPYKGWVWYANMGDLEGSYYISSPDGIHWKHGQMITSINDFVFRQDGWELFGSGDVTTFYPDPENDRFLALIKLANHKAVGPGNRQRARTFMFVDELDARLDPSQVKRADLVPPVAHVNGDQIWDEYYSSTAWRSGSLWIGGLKIWHGLGDYTYSPAGCAFLKFISSRDGLHWEKVQFPNDEGTLGVWIPNGDEGGNKGRNDGGYFTEFSQGPLRIGDELIYYYGSSSWGKNHARGTRVTGGGIFRSRLRIDGFVSVDGGSLTTKPLVCDGRDLAINGIGSITVEVIQEGRSVASSQIKGDSLTHAASFKGRSLAEVAGEGPLQLRFSVDQGGRLYSFTIQ